MSDFATQLQKAGASMTGCGCLILLLAPVIAITIAWLKSLMG